MFQAKQKTMAAFVLAMMVNEYRQGQVKIFYSEKKKPTCFMILQFLNSVAVIDC
jgi:hypothetical protein